MAEYINKADVIAKSVYRSDWAHRYDRCVYAEDIADLPTIDIVTCEECKHWEPLPNGCYGDCTKTNVFVYGTDSWWYCPYGERK